MKVKYLLVLAPFIWASCGEPSQEEVTVEETETHEEIVAEDTETEEGDVYVDGWLSKGDKITADGALTTDEMLAKFEADGGFEGKVSTEILACCQKKGCWMRVDLGNDQEMRVSFKDYGFFVPLDSKGSQVIMQGKAYTDTVSVEMLKHLAEDAGKSQEEIDQITEPEVAMAFEASGVLLKEEN